MIFLKWMIKSLCPIIFTMTMRGYHFTLASSSSGARNVDPSEPLYAYTSEIALWVVNELSMLSDSDIYETLVLKSVWIKEIIEGVFHKNIFLELGIASPFFASTKKEEFFDVIVMEPLPNARNYRGFDYQSSTNEKNQNQHDRVFAMNKFPEMDPKAVEASYIKKVERLHKEREEIHQQLLSEFKVDAQKHREFLAEKQFRTHYEKVFGFVDDEAIENFIRDYKSREKEIEIAAYILEERKMARRLSSLSLPELVTVMKNEDELPVTRFAAKRVFNEKATSLDFHHHLFR